jgi:CRISPR-associated protein Cmr4
MAKQHNLLVFRIRALTNLHAGSGDSFYGAVDKLVQRDPATRLPLIFSHSLKGALREYFEEEKGLGEWSNFVVHVFGSPVKGKPAEATENQTREEFVKPGHYRFFNADLLALPVPEENPSAAEAFHLQTDDAVWTSFLEKTKMLGGAFSNVEALKAAFQQDISPDFRTDAPNLKPGEKFREAATELPVVARNQLDNGKSENLWYEELVPHESIFGFVVQADGDAAHREEFIKNLDGKVLQVGANATVGYGFCHFKLLNPPA